MDMIAVAPLQGFTDAAFRHFHAEIYGAASMYCTPFLRCERGEVRRRDLRDIMSTLNAGLNLLPQILFRDIDEFNVLVDSVEASGHSRVDLNLGCPFPPQVRKGRGAALIADKALLESIAEAMKERPGMTFSVKMRLGVTSPYEFRAIVPVLNAMPLGHVTVHPRTAVQQYGGELYIEQYRELRDMLVHPVIYNGDILTPSDIDTRMAESTAGVMVGRGLLARPSLIAEWREGREWSGEERLERLLQLHAGIFAHHAAALCGETQILMKIKPFWDYLEPEIGHKPLKLIRKASSLVKYEAAVASIG